MIPQTRDSDVLGGIGVTAPSTNRNLYYGLCDVGDVHQGYGGGNGYGESDLESPFYRTVQHTKTSAKAGFRVGLLCYTVCAHPRPAC